MQFDEYQQLAARTLGRDRTHDQQLANAALGLTGESGEVAEIIKKHLFHATPLDQESLVKELGDCLWYIGAFAKVLGLSLNDIAQRNVDKLRTRYPEAMGQAPMLDRIENDDAAPARPLSALPAPKATRTRRIDARAD